MKLFTQEMFRTCSMTADNVAYLADKILAEYLEKNAVKVYKNDKDNFALWDNDMNPDDTHTALLIEIQPIVKEPCKHDPVLVTLLREQYHECRDCGVKLKAEWTEIK